MQSKHKKHQAFEAELAANADRIQSVLAMGQNLIDKRKCAGSEDAVQARLGSIADQWEHLTTKSSEKSMKLKEANKQRTFHAAVKDIDFWLGEVRRSLSLLARERSTCRRPYVRKKPLLWASGSQPLIFLGAPSGLAEVMGGPSHLGG